LNGRRLASRRFVAAFSGAATGANAAIFGLFCYPQALPVICETSCSLTRLRQKIWQLGDVLGNPPCLRKHP